VVAEPVYTWVRPVVNPEFVALSSTYPVAFVTAAQVKVIWLEELAVAVSEAGADKVGVFNVVIELVRVPTGTYSRTKELVAANCLKAVRRLGKAWKDPNKFFSVSLSNPVTAMIVKFSSVGFIKSVLNVTEIPLLFEKRRSTMVFI